MRYGILSDIHGNYDALMSVLRAIDRVGVDQILCLGDIVGYGPEPGPCLEEVKRRSAKIVAGNHDLAAADKISIRTFNVLAREATLWTRNELSEEDLQYLSDLPLSVRMSDLDIAHGTLCSPELFDYVQTSYDAALSMSHMKAPVCFIGHSHVPVSFIKGKIICYTREHEVPIKVDGKVIVNVGSVGQPRDRDPRSCWALYDTETASVTLDRVPYNIDKVSEKVRKAGLPPALGERLKFGR